MSERQQELCYHCGLESDPSYTAVIEDIPRFFCCVGCQCVATTIAQGGFADFYRYRDSESRKAEQNSERFDAYDLEAVHRSFVTEYANGERRVKLQVGGISCAACAWLIEHWLQQLDGVSSARVNVASHRCDFLWDKSRIKLSEVFVALHDIGYRPQPGSEEQQQAARKKERKTALLRIGLAGLGMMQVGMVAVALHAGGIQGMDTTWQHFLRWVSLVFALPVMLYSAQPFFISAWRAIALRHLNMDVPVSLALILAFSASVVASVTNTGEVYFDSVSMFTFFLLVGRFLEMNARHTSLNETEQFSRMLPRAVDRCLSDTETELVPLDYVEVGDEVFVGAGEVVPFDGKLVSEHAISVDEALLTGESTPLTKKQGDNLMAGSVLAEPSMRMRVSAVAGNSRLAAVQALYDEALAVKPSRQIKTDKLASYFVAAVLAVFVGVFCFWYWFDPSRAFWVSLSVLVVTCPCALSLASPAAQAAGLNALRRLGFLVISPQLLDQLPQITHIVFDKTGTLTEGNLQLVETQPLLELERDPLAFVAALEQGSHHPVARAVQHFSADGLRASNRNIVAGRGVEGTIDGAVYRFGRADFASDVSLAYPQDGQWQLLSKNGVPVAWFRFEDAPRKHLATAWSELRKRVSAVSIFSGDRQANVDQFVQSELGGQAIEHGCGDMLPETKMSKVRELQQDGAKVMMLGDGINDVPVLGVADISVALGSATQLTRNSADSVMLHTDLMALPKVLDKGAQVARCIKQNYIWALAYNALALPAAAAGMVPPYVAALGMSISSLVVVLNSTRVGKV